MSEDVAKLVKAYFQRPQIAEGMPSNWKAAVEALPDRAALLKCAQEFRQAVDEMTKKLKTSMEDYHEDRNLTE